MCGDFLSCIVTPLGVMLQQERVKKCEHSHHNCSSPKRTKTGGEKCSEDCRRNVKEEGIMGRLDDVTEDRKGLVRGGYVKKKGIQAGAAGGVEGEKVRAKRQRDGSIQNGVPSDLGDVVFGDSSVGLAEAGGDGSSSRS